MDVLRFELNLRNVLTILGVGLGLLLLFRLQEVLTPFAISFFLAYLLDPLVDRMEQRRLSRTVAIAILFGALTLLLSLAVLYLVPLLYQEILFLAAQVPGYAGKMLDHAQRISEQFSIDLSVEGIKPMVMERLGSISTLAVGALTSVSGSIWHLVQGILLYSIVPILTFYLLRDFDLIVARTTGLLHGKTGVNLQGPLEEFNGILNVYLRGQVLVSLILAGMYTATLLAAGVKPALLLGLVSGVLSIVPYLGFIVGFAAAVILAIFQHGDLLHPLIGVIGFAIAQFLEGNFITPKLVGESLGLHPVAVIMALMIGGSLLGIAGMIIALPLAAFIKVVGERWLEPVATEPPSTTPA